MRRLFVFAAIITICCSANMFAQDVIFMQDETKINARLLEIGEEQIKYKDFDFQDGPTHIINFYDVKMITYENGTTEFFIANNSKPDQNQIAYDLKKDFLQIGTNDKKMLEFFERNNFTEYYDSFNTACKKAKSGKTVICVGIGGIIVGSAAAVSMYNSREPLTIVGIGFSVLGEFAAIAGIVNTAIAGKEKRKIKNDFERRELNHDDYTYLPELRFGLTSNGLGLTLNF